LWNAKSDEPIREGEEVIVTDVERLVVKVKKKGG
jgi:membrane-bound ClpP family serine protease